MQTVKTIIDILRNNIPLKGFINGRVYPFETTSSNVPCIVYTPTPLEDDRVKESWRFEVVVIAKDFAMAQSVDLAVRNALLTLGDSPISNTIMKVVLNGGSNLFNHETNTYHSTGYYYVVARK